ncbi:MAG: LysR family transcriptional regulator [Salaquimonas sp.]
MNWQNVSFDWNQARAFFATAEEGSLSAAARALGQTQPTLGRQITAFEESLGVVLFERVGKSLVLTPSGNQLLVHIRAMYEAASKFSLAASGQLQTIDGKIRITASDVYSVYLMPEFLKILRHAAPLLEVDLVAVNDIQNLQLREADIAIRHIRPEQPDLIAKLIAESTAGFYASKTYLDEVGRPGGIEELARLDFIGVGNNERLISMLSEMGVILNTKNFKIGSANLVAALELAKHGFGIIPIADNIGGDILGLEKVVPMMEPIIFPVWLVAHRELHGSRRIRLVFDLLVDFFQNTPIRKDF